MFHLSKPDVSDVLLLQILINVGCRKRFYQGTQPKFPADDVKLLEGEQSAIFSFLRRSARCTRRPNLKAANYRCFHLKDKHGFMKYVQPYHFLKGKCSHCLCNHQPSDFEAHLGF